MEHDDTDAFLTDAYDIFHRFSTGSHSSVPSAPVDLAPPPPPPPPSSPYMTSPDINGAYAEDISTMVIATTSELSTVPTANSSSHEPLDSSPVPTPLSFLQLLNPLSPQPLLNSAQRQL